MKAEDVREEINKLNKFNENLLSKPKKRLFLSNIKELKHFYKLLKSKKINEVEKQRKRVGDNKTAEKLLRPIENVIREIKNHCEYLIKVNVQLIKFSGENDKNRKTE